MRLRPFEPGNIWGQTRRYGGAIVAFGALILGASRCADLTAPTGLSSVSILFRGIPLPRPDTIQLIVGDRVSPDIVVMLGTQEQPRARHVFASSDTNVVKVFAQGDSIEVTGRGFARLIVSLVGATIGGNKIDPNTRTADTVTVAAAAATNVVTPATLTLEAFTAKTTLTAQSLGRNNQVIEGTDIVWRSLNSTIASVNATTGEVTAVGNGTTDIYAVFEGVDSTFSRVTVAQKLKKYKLTTATGASFRSINETMPVISTPLDSLDVPFGPGSITPAVPSFQSSKPGQVEIHPSTGVMTARANTNATDLPLITATAAGAVVSDPLPVAVTQVAKTISIALPPTVTISSIGAKLENVAVSALDSLGTQVPSITWDLSPRNGVASVDQGTQTATITAQQTGSTYIRAFIDQVIDSVRLTVTNDPATVELSPKPFALTSLNQTATLTATVRNAAGTVLTSGVTLTWLSRDSSIVEPQPTQGAMLARALGETRIVVTTQNNVSDSINVRVTNAPDTVRIIPDTIRLTNVGDMNNTFAVDFKNGLGATLGKSSVTWISADVNVAQVAVGTGVITAIGSGITYVLAVSPENPVRRDSVFVVVTNDATSMTVSPSTPQTLTSFGATLNFSATVFNSAGNPIAGAPVTWSVPVGGAFLSIDAVTGVATAVANGPATVRATSGGVVRNVSVTVAQAFSPARSTITPTAASIVANGTSTTTVTVQLKDANDNNLTFGGDTVVTSISPAGIGSLGAVTDAGNGRYTATLTASTTAGTATITASVNAIAIANNAIVAMTAAPAAKYVVTSTSQTPVAGSSVTIRAQLADANNNPVATAGNAVTFSSTNGGTFTGANPATTDATGAAQITFNTSATASTHTISATTGALTGASPAITSVAAGATNYLVTPATTSPAAGSVVTVSAQLRDANGNAVAQPGQVVAWTKSDPNGAFSGGASSTTNASGVASIDLTTHTAAGTATTVTATTGGLTGTSATITTAPGPASVATTQITTNVGTVVAGGQATVTVQARDVNSNDLTASGGTVLLSTSLGSLNSTTDNANGTYTATLSTTTAGTATITGTLNGIAITDNAVVTVTVTGATASAAQSVASVPAGTAGSLTTIAIQAKDQFGNNMQSGGSTVQVTVSGANTVAQFTAADNGNGTYTATYTPTIAGTDNIAITLGGSAISGSPYSSVVNAGALTNFLVDAFGPIATQAAGTPFNITITARDASGNTVTSFSAGSNTVDITSTGTLSAGGGTTTAFSNGVLTRAVTISNTGNFTITATRTTGGAQSGTSNTFTVTAGAASLATSTIAAVSTAITADQTTAITVTLRDANNNPLSASGGTVSLSPSIGTLSSVTNNSNGTYSATYTATTAGTATITGTLNGAGFADNEVITVTPGVASAATTTITASPTSVAADGAATSTITVQVKDADGNNLTTEADVVVLTANPGSVNLPVTPVAGTGSYSATLPGSTTSGLVTITGTVNAAAITDNATVMRTAAAATAYTVTPASLNVASGGTVLVTAQLVDGNGNPVATSGKTVSWTSNQNGGAFAGGAQFPTPFSTTDANGAAVIAFTVSTTAGNVHRVRATDNTALTGTSPTDIVVIAGPVSGANSTIAASPTTIETTGADGSPISSTITVTLRDASGNIRTTGGDGVVLNTSLGALSVVTDNGDGTYSATLTSATTGTANITGTGNGVNITGATGTVTVLAAPSGANSSIAATPTTIETTGANGSPTTSAITVTLRDGANAQLPHGNDVVVLNTSLGSLGSVTDNGDGTYTATLTAGATAGTANITGTVNGAAIGTPAAVTIVLAPSGANSSIAAAPSLIAADGAATSNITVTLRDGANVQLTHGADAVVLNTTRGALGLVTDNGDGTYSAVLTSSAEATTETATVSGTVNGAAIGTSAVVTFSAANGANSSIAATPTTIETTGANGSPTTSAITVTLRNGANAALSTGGDAVVLNTDLGTLGAVTDNGDGTYSATLTAGTTAGTANITGTVNGAAIGTPAVVTILLAPSGANSAITGPANVTAGTSATITVTLSDAAATQLTHGGDGPPALVLNTTRGTLSFDSDNGNGTYTFTLSTVAGDAGQTATITGTINGAAIGTPAAVPIIP